MNNTSEMTTSANKKEIRLAKSDLLMMLGFILALAVLCFTLGVRLGKKQALSDYQKLSMSQKMAETKRSEILEKINEEVEVIKPKEKEALAQVIQEKVIEKKNPFTQTEKMEEVVKKVEIEVPPKKIVEEEVVKKPVKVVVQEKTKPVKTIKPVLDVDPIPFLEAGNPALSNSYTIIIGEFMEYDEASLFAQAFKERGYQPFLQKYSKNGIDKIRVSLGSYISKEKAEKFILDRSEVFISGKYKINKFL